ncbi:MAG: domain S-box [Deltaproteobacteria bacterium]|nr:domain S-box [Deltaproteobacteria bacterium]
MVWTRFTMSSTPVDDLLRENAALQRRIAQLERVVSIVEASSEAIVAMALDDTLVSWNAAAERLYGFTAAEAIGRSHLELVPFDRLAEHATAVERALRGEPVVLETRRRRDDGSEVVVVVTYARLAEPSGKLLGLSTIAHARAPADVASAVTDTAAGTR